MGHNATSRLCRRKWFRPLSRDQVREAQAVAWGGAPMSSLGLLEQRLLRVLEAKSSKSRC